MISADTLSEAARIVRTELPKHLTSDFVINNVRAESRPGQDEDYIHIRVILEDDHPALDPRRLMDFNMDIHPIFQRSGIIPSPTITYANRGELNQTNTQRETRMEPLRIYVAGPYTGADRQEIDRNVNRAIDAGIEIFHKGHFPYVPHLTDLIDRRARETGREMSWSDFMSWDAPWLEACDALVHIGASQGANIELEEAKRLGKKIFYSSSEIPSAHGTDD